MYPGKIPSVFLPWVFWCDNQITAADGTIAQQRCVRCRCGIFWDQVVQVELSGNGIPSSQHFEDFRNTLSSQWKNKQTNNKTHKHTHTKKQTNTKETITAALGLGYHSGDFQFFCINNLLLFFFTFFFLNWKIPTQTGYSNPGECYSSLQSKADFQLQHCFRSWIYSWREDNVTSFSYYRITLDLMFSLCMHIYMYIYFCV